MTITDVKKLLKDRRIELGLTMKQVADFVGVSEGTVSRWEAGEIANMKRNRIVALAQILRISPAQIMGWDNPGETKKEYYTNPETVKLAQELHDNPEYKALLDSTRGLKPESIKEIMAFIKYQKAKENGETE